LDKRSTGWTEIEEIVGSLVGIMAGEGLFWLRDGWVWFRFRFRFGFRSGDGKGLW
jgi:hypothetical protein